MTQNIRPITVDLTDPKTTRNHVLEAMTNKLAFYMDVVREYLPEDKKGQQAVEFVLNKAVKEGNIAAQFVLNQLREIPVTIEEFITGKHYLNEKDIVWDNVLKDIIDLNPYLFDSHTPSVAEVILSGAIGTAKSYIAFKGIQYLVYVLNCFKKPQKLFNLDPNVRIVIVLLSTSETVARKVLFEPIRDGYTAMEYYARRDTPSKDDDIKNSLFFPETKVEVIPRTALPTSYIGQAVIGGIMDEVNFLQYVEQSKQVAGKSGQGGLFDQAQLNYSALTQRKQSRFLNRNISLGTLYLCSSLHYADDFLERRINEERKLNNPSVKILRRKQYEVVPQERFSGKKFRFLIGNNDYPSRPLGTEEIRGTHFHQDAQVIEDVPVEYYQAARKDPEGFQRDVLAVPTTAVARFITQVNKIFDSFKRAEKKKLKHWVVKPDVELASDGFLKINPENLPKDRKTPRFVHVDGSSTGDRTGIAIGKVCGWIRSYDPDNDIEEYLPHIEIELACSIQPDKAHEISMPDIRKFLITLRDTFRINIKKVSYDQYQSRESQQLLRKRGFIVEHISVDKPIDHYLQLKDVLYEDRLDMIETPMLKLELPNLERDEKKNKIEHLPKLSKDVSDAVCGVVTSILQNRTVLYQTYLQNRLEIDSTKKFNDAVQGMESYRGEIVTDEHMYSNKDIL